MMSVRLRKATGAARYRFLGAFLCVQPAQEGQFLLDFSLQAAISQPVEGRIEAIGEIVLGRGVAMRFVVGIAIGFAMAQLLHQLGRRIAQMNRHRRAAVLGDELARLCACVSSPSGEPSRS